MKRNHMRIMGAGALMICMAVIMLFSAFRADASETKEVKYVEGINYTEDNTIPEITDATLKTELEGYLFAGWYTQNEDGKTYNPVSNPELNNSSYYAKYVPKEVLDIKAQVSGTLCNEITTDDTSASIRFVTTIDSTEYKAISFNIKRADKTEAYDAETTNYVYKELYAVDATVANDANKLKTYKPSVFHATSQFFKTWTFSEIPEIAYNTDITVTPFWITLDGTRVEGTTSIKTVNLGRSWVYINTSANTDGTQSGTYAHPFTDLTSALEAIVLDKNGRIVIQSTCENSTFTVPSSFKWEKHGKDLTITGEGEKTETLDFSSITNFRMGDSVTFENMTLKLPTSQLYADGHRFKIAETVNSENSGLIIFGGGNSNNVTGDTSVTLLAGSYEAVYGGGLNGDVNGDTYVNIQNVNIYDTSKNNYRYVCGGGRKGNVTGNTYVTVGEGFNSKHEWDNHGYLSAVFGGGYGADGSLATVEGDTYVVIKDGAKTNYVHGAGTSYSEVKGTSHVTFDGGYAMSIYGGGSSVQAANSNTSVIMKNGTVEQIFGGNLIGMTGNTDVRILGGTVKRRVFGGCYNEDASENNQVTGYTNVLIGPKANLTFDYNVYNDDVLRSVSRYGSFDGEWGTFIFNENSNYINNFGDSNSDFGSPAYHYRVTTNGNNVDDLYGNVEAAGGYLHIEPKDSYIATVTIGEVEICSFTDEGDYPLPALADKDSQTDIIVTFSETTNDINTEMYEAQIGTAYYKKLDDAISAVNTFSTIAETTEEVAVTLLKDIEIEETLNIAESAKVTITNTAAVTITASETMSGDMFNVAPGGTLSFNGVATDKKITLAGGVETNYVLLNSGTILLSNADITGGVRGIHNNQGTIGTEENPLKNVSIIGASEYGLYTYGGNVNVGDIVVRNSGADAIRIQREEANVMIQKAELYDSASYGLVVKNGTVTVKNTLIDNAGITDKTKNRIGIAAHGGTLTLDNVTVQNFVGNSTYKANHGIDHQGGQLIVTANETVDGGNKGLYIYNVKGHGIYSTGGSMDISKITIIGNNQTRAGIQLTGNTSSENKVSNATITGCSVQIQLKNASLWIESTFVQETANQATNYKTDGTKQ